MNHSRKHRTETQLSVMEDEIKQTGHSSISEEKNNAVPQHSRTLENGIKGNKSKKYLKLKHTHTHPKTKFIQCNYSRKLMKSRKETDT